MRASLPLLFALLTLPALAPAALAAELDDLKGEWTVERAEKNGQQVPDSFAKRMKVVFDGGKLTLDDGNGKETVTIKLDERAEPHKTIDFVHEDGKTAPGIYALSGDSLRMCWRKGGGDRPARFAISADSGLVLMVLKRKK